jgi:beta-phosphoglucomutase-like phosphatase (HAD superfamily)
MLDSVLFELDGVLADTAEARRDALLSTLAAEGVVLSDTEYRETCGGLTFEEAVRAASALRGAPADGPALSVAALRAERTFRAYLGKGLTMTDGARDVADRFAAVARLGIVTRVGRAEAELILELARLDHVFTCVIAAEDAFPTKPAPAPYRKALERLERQRPIATRALVVALEDSLAGIRSARSAGIACVAVGDLPAHVAMEANALVGTIKGLTPDGLLALVTRSAEPIA